MTTAEKLLKRMRQTLTGWRPSDFETLYRGFGFKSREGRDHTVYIHTKYPQLRATVARHGSLAKGYAEHAVKTIDQLLALQAQEKEEENGEESEE